MMDFDAARRAVQQELDRLFADEAESPAAQAYGFATGAAWAPIIRWDGIMGAYIYLANKRTGMLTPLSLPDFENMPDPRRVGSWPRAR